MPSLKDIRNRIKSVKSTQKITKAMKMVAAAKVKRAENRMKASRPYTQALRDVMADVYHELRSQAGAFSGSPYLDLLQPREIKNVGVVVISSDRGLCGSYNANIIKQAFKLEKELIAQGYTPKFYLVGNKVINAFKRYSESEVLGTMGGITSAPSKSDANQIADSLVQAFLDDKIDSIDILSTDFVSMISYQIHMVPVIPTKGITGEVMESFSPDQGYDETKIKAPRTGLRSELLLEPDPVKTLEQIIPMYVSQMLYMQLLEGTASELAARMSAMSNATKNAGEMIDNLSTIYNKARQASITQEILEIVAGAEALN